MVEVELNADDYKVILSWYEIAFAKKKTKIKDVDMTVMHKLMIMCKSILDDVKKFTSDNNNE